MRKNVYICGPVVKNLLSSAGTWVQSLVGELRFPHTSGQLSQHETSESLLVAMKTQCSKKKECVYIYICVWVCVAKVLKLLDYFTISLINTIL